MHISATFQKSAMFQISAMFHISAIFQVSAMFQINAKRKRRVLKSQASHTNLVFPTGNLSFLIR